jgi:ABC-type Fe3+-hydroxamate transport system substrate-binding protein
MSLLPRYLLVLGLFLGLAALTVWGFVVTSGFDRTQGKVVTAVQPPADGSATGNTSTTGRAATGSSATTQKTGGANATGTTDDAEPLGLRIVSLAPAISQMLADLGMSRFIVGKGEYDVSAPKEARIVGNFQDVNLEALVSTKPGLVLMMVGASGVPRPVTDQANKKRFELIVYSAPLTIAETLNILHNPEADQYLAATQPDLATVLGDPESAIRLRRSIDMQLQAVSDAVAGQARPKVLAAFGGSPIMASGPNTVNDELIKIAGGTNAAAAAKIGAPTFDSESLLALNPDVILLLSPGGAPLGPMESDPRLAGLRGLPIKAVVNNRVVLLNDPLILLPSSNIAKSAALFAQAIHPDKAKEIQFAVDAAAKVARDMPLSLDDAQPATIATNGTEQANVKSDDNPVAATVEAAKPTQIAPATQPAGAATQPAGQPASPSPTDQKSP